MGKVDAELSGSCGLSCTVSLLGQQRLFPCISNGKICLAMMTGQMYVDRPKDICVFIDFDQMTNLSLLQAFQESAHDAGRSRGGHGRGKLVSVFLHSRWIESTVRIIRREPAYGRHDGNERYE